MTPSWVVWLFLGRHEVLCRERHCGSKKNQSLAKLKIVYVFLAQLDKMGFGWSKKSVRGGVGGAPGQLTPTRSETDFSEMDENAHLAIDSLNEDEVNAAFEKMLVRIVFFR